MTTDVSENFSSDALQKSINELFGFTLNSVLLPEQDQINRYRCWKEFADGLTVIELGSLPLFNVRKSPHPHHDCRT